VSETVSNVYHLIAAGQPLDDRASLQQVQDGTMRLVEGQLEVGFSMPPSSVALVTLTRRP